MRKCRGLAGTARKWKSHCAYCMSCVDEQRKLACEAALAIGCITEVLGLHTTTLVAANHSRTRQEVFVVLATAKCATRARWQ